MKIFPAIDIKDSAAVRLTQGDYDRVTVFNQDPVKVALEFKEAGADFLHIVDLDGAKDGELSNFDTVKKIAETGLQCQVGGGIRSLERISKYISIGCTRVILGSSALDSDFLEAALKEYGDKIAVSVDAKDGKVATHGWLKVSDLDAFEFCRDLTGSGVKTIICTDISKDGAMTGTNLELYRRLQSEINADIVASGGISSLDEIKELRSYGMYGAILGKSLYLGAIKLEEAIEAAQ